jgi:hypothetical protein
MNEEVSLVNRVSNSGLTTISLESFFPEEEIITFDVKDYLFKGLILKELDFRQALKDFDWSTVSGKILTVHCSSEAIIPTWAYMLVATYANKWVKDLFFGNKEEALRQYFRKKLDQLDGNEYQDAKLVIKGCSDKPVPASAYMDITNKLLPFASSIMFGEPCSTVPVYKRPKV